MTDAVKRVGLLLQFIFFIQSYIYDLVCRSALIAVFSVSSATPNLDSNIIFVYTFVFYMP